MSAKKKQPSKPITTRLKTSQIELRTMDRSMKQLTRLLKSPTRSPRKKPENSNKKIPKDVEDKEFLPDKFKRKLSAKKVVLKPKYNSKVVATTNKRKMATPCREISSANTETTPGVASNIPPKAPRSLSPELSITEAIRLMEETNSLSDEDFMEILTCPSPVWWEDPPDGYNEDPICSLPELPENKVIQNPTIKDTSIKIPTNTDNPTQNNQTDFQKELDQLKLIKKDIPKDDRFEHKKTKLENVLGNIKKRGNVSDKEKDAMNTFSIKNRKVSSSTDDLYSEKSFNEEEILKDLESIEIPIEDDTKQSEDRTKQSKNGTKQSDDGTKQIQNETKLSEDVTKQSENDTKQCENKLKQSEDGIKQSEDGTKRCEDEKKECDAKTKHASLPCIKVRTDLLKPKVDLVKVPKTLPPLKINPAFLTKRKRRRVVKLRSILKVSDEECIESKTVGFITENDSKDSNEVISDSYDKNISSKIDSLNLEIVNENKTETDTTEYVTVYKIISDETNENEINEIEIPKTVKGKQAKQINNFYKKCKNNKRLRRDSGLATSILRKSNEISDISEKKIELNNEIRGKGCDFCIIKSEIGNKGFSCENCKEMPSLMCDLCDVEIEVNEMPKHISQCKYLETVSWTPSYVINQT